MKLAKDKVGEGMFLIVEDMLKKTKLLCNISDTVLVEEALTFLEENKVRELINCLLERNNINNSGDRSAGEG